MKILNLFAGIGGNRTNWDQIPNLEITAIEQIPEIGEIYQQRFPHDEVIITDAYEYNQKHFEEFDLIWASPPCQSHTRLNATFNKIPIYPDLRLYALIIFLNKWFKKPWVVENVIPYYSPIKIGLFPIQIERHLFWSNRSLHPLKNPNRIRDFCKIGPKKLAAILTIDYELLKQLPMHYNRTHDFRRQVLRNCVRPELGLHLLRQLIQNQFTIIQFIQAGGGKH